MNIAFASDENYVKYLIVSIVSLMETNKKNKITFYIIDNNILNISKKLLKDKVIEYKQNIIFIDSNELTESLEVDDTFPKATYSRLFLTEIDIDKILYLDCDSLVTSDLSTLWNENLNGYYYAGVVDPVSIHYKKSIGLERNDVYINAGFLLMNLKEMRKFNWNSRVVNFLEKYNGSVPHHDQGVINALGKEKIKVILPKYNVMDVYYLYSYEQMNKIGKFKLPYSISEYTEAKKCPVFIHFTTGFYGRVWDTKCRHPRKQLYWDMVGIAGFNLEYFLIDKSENINATRMNTLFKMLPFSIYCIISDLAVKRKVRKRMK